LSSVFKVFGRSGDEEKDKEVLRDKIQEVEVEREMEREKREEKREAEDFKIIEQAGKALTSRTGESPGGNEDELCVAVERILLSSHGTSKVVQMKVVEQLGMLYVLRDVG
jgi:hypothetical protein